MNTHVHGPDRARTRTIVRLAVTAAAAAVTAALVVPAGAGAAPSVKAIPVVTATLGSSVSLSRTHLYPGRVTFKISAPQHSHTLQIARLRPGYTVADANKDIGMGFGGNVTAIRRVDANVAFLGGATGTPKKTGYATVVLPAGSYVAVNLDTGAAAPFTVSGAGVHRATVKSSAEITMLTYGFDMKSAIPRSGVIKLGNISDQPHFVVLQHVKTGTTRAQLTAAFRSESNSKPAFVLPGSTESAVLSPYRSEQFSYKLPAGTYVIACFWPDDDTGMVHAAMGMYKIITLT